MSEDSRASRPDRRSAWLDGLLCAATWFAVLLYAWNHRVFLAQAAKLLR